MISNLPEEFMPVLLKQKVILNQWLMRSGLANHVHTPYQLIFQYALFVREGDDATRLYAATG